MIDTVQETDAKKEFRDMLKKTKNTAESYVVLSIYRNTELYFDSSLTADDFHDPIWKMYFAIADQLINSGKKVLDDIVVGLRVSENEALSKMFEECGGYQTIANGIAFVQEENFDSYLLDIKKYNALIKLHDLGFPVMEKFDNYKLMSVDKVQSTLQSVLDSIFADVYVEEKVTDLSDNLWKTVMDAHEGVMRGFPYQSAMLTEHVNGMALGNITMLSANSGIGKSFLTLAQILPNMIEFDEKLLIIANEEGEQKWKREIIIWAVNNVIESGDFEKGRFNQGNFSKDELTILKKGVDWLDAEMKKGTISFINFNSFSMDKALRTMKKQNSINGVRYFVIDTLKLDSDALNENSQAWLSLMQNMVKLDDLCKPSNRNIHCWVTFQLGKSALMTRYLSQNSLGMSKNTADVVTTLLLVRKALESEKEGGKNEVEVKGHHDGKNKKMKPDKDYFIMFLGKNRNGQTTRQLVFEVDISRNRITDFGTCLIPQDI
ncbi:hypothetical protein [Bacillus paranthracis]|uniref:hypothetical protein n=1 Tax=Bacillus paranthracis TaxID=2026186 RepID=UPI002D78B28A|nr:hypothetical protein [Bacillus paranthracis]